MFFLLSKILWLLASPTNLLVLMLCGGGALGIARRTRWSVRVAMAAAVGFVLCGVLPTGTLLYRILEDRFPPIDPGETPPVGIIVLGGAVDPVIGASRGQVSITDAATRMTEGVVLARRYPQARLVYSGGSNAILATIGGEAEDAERLWAAMGVDPGRIVIEDKSRNTDENARFSRDLLRPAAGERWLLVTSAYHMPRAMGLFRAAGFPVVPVPVDYRTTGTWRDYEPNRDFGTGLARFDAATREWAGLIAYRLTGRTASLFPGP